MWILDSSCVTVEPIDRACPNCGDASASHLVRLDLGSQTVAIFEGCEPCADDLAGEMKGMLPSEAVPV